MGYVTGYLTTGLADDEKMGVCEEVDKGEEAFKGKSEG